MPHSLILNLLPTSPIPPGYLSGKHLHALFLTLVSSVDQALGDRLHTQKTDKAFALSPLQVYESKRVDEWMGNQAMNHSAKQPTKGKQHLPLHPSTPSTPPPLHPSTHRLQWQHSHPIPAGTP